MKKKKGHLEDHLPETGVEQAEVPSVFSVSYMVKTLPIPGQVTILPPRVIMEDKSVQREDLMTKTLLSSVIKCS